MFDLTGKVAIVTGAAQGIGQAMAIALAEAGADVSCIDMKTMEETQELIKATGRRSLALVQDLSELDKIPGLVQQTLDEFGKIDILINCAGVSDRGLEPEKLSWQEYETIMKINLHTMTKLSLEVYKIMVRQGTGGKIINISSILALVTSGGSTAYATSKNGIIGLTKAMAVAGAKHNIWVNAVAPGSVITQMVTSVYKNFTLDAPFLPTKRRLLPENMKGITIFLTSKESDFITGQVICTDAGLQVRNVFDGPEFFDLMV